MTLKKMGLCALAAVGMLTVPAKAPAQFDQGTIETVALILLADKLGLDPDMVAGLTGGGTGGLMGGGSLYDLAPLLVMKEQLPNQSLGNLVSLRNQGLSWDSIATRTKMNPDAYARLRTSGRLNNNNIWRETVINELNLSSDTVTRLRNMGLSWKDIVMTTIVSRESGRSLSAVANSYLRSHNWNTVANTYKLNRTRMASRVTSWRQTRTVPSAWRSNSTGWATMKFVPPGLAKKGGVPPGQAKKFKNKGNNGKHKGHG